MVVRIGEKYIALSVVRQTEQRGVEQLWLASVVPAGEIRHDVCDFRGARSREVEFTLSPGSNECVEIVDVPSSAVPGVSQEEFRAHFVGLQVSNVDDPNPVSVSLKSL